MNKLMDYCKQHRKQIVERIVMLVFMVLIIYYFIGNMKHSADENKMTIKNVVGEVKYIRGEKETILEEGSEVYCGGTFYSGDNSGATVIFREGKTVELLSNCTMEVNSKNSIDNVNSMGACTMVKSYDVTITKGEAIVDISSTGDNGYFKVSTLETNFYTGDTKTHVCRQEEYGVTYITVDRGNIELTGTNIDVKEGTSVYCKNGRIRRCATMTLEKNDAFLFSFIESGREACYKIYSGDRVGESNISYNGDTVDVHNLEFVQQAYDILDEIYAKAMDGETVIKVTDLNGTPITVHITDNNGILTFDPIDDVTIYYSMMIRL